MAKAIRTGTGALLALLLVGWPTWPAWALDDEADRLARAVLDGRTGERAAALEAIEARGGTDLVAPLIQTLRFFRSSGGDVAAVLGRLTGADIGNDWHAWTLWQQRHPELAPYDGFGAFKADVMARLDPAFRLFLKPGVRQEIRLEEIVWGGVAKDGIPALVDPKHVAAGTADWLEDDEPVFGIEIAGDVRAWPLRILDWHEMANDVIGGLPVALAYCTLCGSGILFETRREDGGRFVFGSSGLLYRSNKLMYDRATHSLWNQFTGRPVVGPLTGSGIELEVLPVVITSWADWRERHPTTRVLSLDTGHERDYTPGQPYGAYFASPDLMFPSVVTDGRLAPKAQVFALRHGGTEKAWPLERFEAEPVINDDVGGLPVVLIGDAAFRSVRAYERGGRAFRGEGDGVVADGVTFEVTEDALLGADGTRLGRLPGHVAYWFAWQSFRPDAEVAGRVRPKVPQAAASSR